MGQINNLLAVAEMAKIGYQPHPCGNLRSIVLFLPNLIPLY